MTCEVWLEIEDASSSDSERRVRWRWQVRSRSGNAEVAFVSPLSKHAWALARSYVREFRSWRATERDWALTAERTLLHLGRALGDALVDPSYRLLSFCEWLEREGLASLHVAVLGAGDLPWELLVLPDSAYTVAAAGAAFVRAPVGSRPLDEPARALGLDAEHPLRFLRLDADTQVGGISLAWTQLGWQGALHYRRATWPDRSEPWHIVHASIAVRGDTISLDSTSLPALDFVAQVRELGAELLILEPRPESDPAEAIALEALRAGIDNVLILSEPNELGWPSDWLASLLELIGGGLGLRRAVVETRKHMQRALLEARQSENEQPHAAQQWHVLHHYSLRDLQFFECAQPRVPFESSEAYAALRGSLFGFAHFPPAAPDFGDAAVLTSLQRLRTDRVVCVDAVHGGGLSHVLHRAALFARANGDVGRAYYWNFAREAFTVRDVLEMVHGARGQTDPAMVNERDALQPLAVEPELFVFDDVDALDAELLTALAALAQRIAEAGGLCLIGSHAPLSIWARVARVSVPPLSERECVACVKATAPRALGLGPQVFALLERLQGHPLLLRKMLASCTEETLNARLAEASEGYADRAHALEQFYARRWLELPRYWQEFLLAWLPLDGLYLQLLMIAVDRPGGDQSAAGRALRAMLEVPAAVSFASGIAQLEAAGFVTTSGPGAQVDPAALRFLRAQGSAEPPALGLQLARLVCEGVVRVLSRREHEDLLSGHLLRHRALLRRQLETIARAGDYPLAARACMNLHALLVRARLNEEACDWARALLETAGASFCTHADPLVATVWLGVALRARLHPADGIIELGARHWADRLRAVATDSNATWRGVFPLVVAFLEKTYDVVGDYAAYRNVAQFACEQHRANADVLALIPQLHALAAAEHALGHGDERELIERELIEGIAYPELAGGAQLRRQTLAQLAGARLRRADERGVEALLERMEHECDGEAPNALALFLRGELALQRADWEFACELECRVWSAVLSRKQQEVDVDSVARRLRQLEQRIGAERFAAIYAQYAAATPTPSQLGAGAPN